MDKTLLRLGLAFAGATLTLGLMEHHSAQAATVINAAPTWNGSSAVSAWGITNTSTYGQTFTVAGPDNILTSFSFQIGQTSSPIPFAAYIAEWAGGPNGNVVGSLLYNSGLQSFSNPGGGFQQAIFNTGNLLLNTGSKYVAFLSTSGFQAGQPSSTTNFGFVGGDDYAGGEFVYYNTGDNFSPLLNSNWGTLSSFAGDVAFQANLTSSATAAVPTPALLPALLGMGAAALRKRKGDAAEAEQEAVKS
jgi:hypothetical protein